MGYVGDGLKQGYWGKRGVVRARSEESCGENIYGGFNIIYTYMYTLNTIVYM